MDIAQELCINKNQYPHLNFNQLFHKVVPLFETIKEFLESCGLTVDFVGLVPDDNKAEAAAYRCYRHKFITEAYLYVTPNLLLLISRNNKHKFRIDNFGIYVYPDRSLYAIPEAFDILKDRLRLKMIFSKKQKKRGVINEK